MSASSQRGDEYSRGPEVENRPAAQVAGEPGTPPAGDAAVAAPGRGANALAILAAAGVAALVAATFLPVLRIQVSERVITSLDSTGWDRHGASLLVLAALAALMISAARRGSTAAAAALTLAGVAALAIVIGSDLPDVGDVGPIGDRLREGKVGTGLGAHAEALGGVLLLATGGLLTAINRRD